MSEILDSGTRREFATGAVRDMVDGKGRCDLMPLDVVAEVLEDTVLRDVSHFVADGNCLHLIGAIRDFAYIQNINLATIIIEVSKHFEDGAKKYGENNWQKGLPVSCYIDSAVRHYLKFLRGDTDERHDRAFVWNLMCCVWTVKHHDEL